MPLKTMLDAIVRDKGKDDYARPKAGEEGCYLRISAPW